MVIRKFRTTTQHGAIAGVMQKFGNSEFLQTRFKKEQSLKELERDIKSPNQIVDFIRFFLAPSRFVGKSDLFEKHRTELNGVLVMVGLEFRKDGKFYRVKPAATLEEAEKRVQNILGQFKGRAIHYEVNKYCKAELMQDNYFHAVFEATKGLAQRIRELSGADGDGVKLIDKVFSGEHPLLAINSLCSEPERSEQRGFAQFTRRNTCRGYNHKRHDICGLFIYLF